MMPLKMERRTSYDRNDSGACRRRPSGGPKQERSLPKFP